MCGAVFEEHPKRGTILILVLVFLKETRIFDYWFVLRDLGLGEIGCIWVWGIGSGSVPLSRGCRLRPNHVNLGVFFCA